MTLLFVLPPGPANSSEPTGEITGEPFPRPLDQYEAPAQSGNPGDDRSRAPAAEPFNVVATCHLPAPAIVHTFLAPKFMHIAHRWRDEHQRALEAAISQPGTEKAPRGRDRVSFKAEIMHFFGEVEAIFGIWIVPLLVAITLFKDWDPA